MGFKGSFVVLVKHLRVKILTKCMHVSQLVIKELG